MAGNLRGEITFEALGRTWRMHYTVNGLCALEDAAGVGVQEFLSGIEAATRDGRLRFGDIRLLFWSGLQEHHPDIDVAGAGRIVTDLGGIEAAQGVMERALAAAFPGGGGDGENPRTG